MSRRTVFEWIRAASSAEMTDGCRAFCLQLIPLVDSKTLRCSLPIYQVSTRVSAKMGTIKKYRRQLKALGLIDKGQGWELTVNGERLTSGCTDTQGVHTDTGTSEQWTQGHPKVSTQPPPIYYRSTSLSTFIVESINPLALMLDESHQNLFESASVSLLSVLVGGIIFLVLAWTTFFKLDVSVRKKVQVFSAALIWLLIMGWVINVVFSLTLWTVHNLNFWIFFVLILLLRWPFISINDFAPGARTVFGKGESKPR